jgi:hypothetical protein
MRCSLVLAAALLAGCSGGGGGSSTVDEPSFRDSDSSGGIPIKLSYVAFQPQTDAKGTPTGWKHTYKYMLSTGWMNKRGPSPREPFERIWARDAYVGQNIHDARMIEMLKVIDAAGFRDLRETPLARIDLDRLKRIEQTGDKDAAAKTRIITIETEEFRRTVASYDNSAPGLVEKFRAVEREVIKCVFANTIQVTKDSQSTMPRGKN